MSDLTKFSDGAAILQQVDVSSIFKNLAMGIAEAQQKLDDNSIAQAIKLAETKIDGVSLLQLGFSPVFYAFQYADISASINLQMALKEELEFGFGLSIELATKKGYSEEDRKFIGEDNYSETQKEYKSSTVVNFRSKDKHATTIEGHSYMINEDLKAKSRVENLKNQILEQETNVEQIYDEINYKNLTQDKSRGIDVWMDGGYLRVEGGIHYKVNGGTGVLKITNFAVDKAIDVNGAGTVGNFTLSGNLHDSLGLAKSANGTSEVYGISKSGDMYVHNLVDNTWEPVSSQFYFAYNRDEITYGEDLHHEGDPNNLQHPTPVDEEFENKNHDFHPLIHRVLRLIQKNDPKAVITITGSTDPKGGDNKNNQSLAKRRAEKLRNHIFGTGTPVNVVTAGNTNPTGGSDLEKRYAKITLNADYIVFVGGAVNKSATPGKTAETANKFVYAEQSTDGNFEKLDVQYGGISLAYSVDETTKNMETLAQYVKGKIGESTHEKVNDSLYFLEDEAIIKFYLMNSNSEDINVEIAEENSSEGTETTNTWMNTKTKNQKSLLSDSLNKKNKDTSFALGASVDFRLSRQFEMSMEGNSAMSARLVAAPAPTGFLNFVQNVFGNNTEE